MNHTYRLVWNRSMGMFVAVCEFARTMGKSGGGKARAVLKSLGGAAIAAAAASSPAWAHTTSVGYEVLPSSTVEVWYGTYHLTAFTEGSLSFTSTNGYSATVAFTDLVSVKPTGLVDGTTNFFSNGSSLVGTANRTINTWQGVRFSNLSAGTYTFTYLPIAQPTSDWQPIDNVIRSGTFVITSQQLGNNAIDTAASSYAASALGGGGTVAFQGGTLQADTDGATLAQNFTLNTQGGTIDQAGRNVTLTGTIADLAPGTAGSLTIANSGNGSGSGGVTVTAANTYTGATTVASGASLTLSGNGSIAGSSGARIDGSLVVAGNAPAQLTTLSGNGGVTLANQGLVLRQAAGTFAGTIGGTGDLTVAGGTETLSGTNTFTGTVNVSHGAALQVSADDNLGNAGNAIALDAGTLRTTASFATSRALTLNDGAVIDTAAGSTLKLAGDITAVRGDGCVMKAGSGTLNMAGASRLGIGMCVAQGVVRANGLVDSTFVRIDAGAMLRGTGTVHAPVTVYGTLAPGNSPGTLTTDTMVTMTAASTYQEDINGTGTGTGPGNYSRLLLNGAGGIFVAGGATLAPNLTHITGADTYTAYVPKVGDAYRIVTAGGGIVGRFGTLVQPEGLAADTRLAVFYDGDGTHSIDLRVLPTSYAQYVPAHGGNRNAQAAGTVLDAVVAADQAGAASAAQSRLAYLATRATGADAATLARNLSGEVHAAMAAAAPLAGQSLQTSVQRQLAGGQAGANRNTQGNDALWADLVGNRARWSDDSVASGLTANRGQLTVGLDALRAGAGRIGVGVSHAKANVGTSFGSGALRENLAFVYGDAQLGRFTVDALAGAGRAHTDTRRDDPLGGTQALTTSSGGHTTQGSIGISLPAQVGGHALAPFARVAWQRVARDAGSESGASVAALDLADYAATGTRVTAGVAGHAQGGDPLQSSYTVQYSAALGHDGGALARPHVTTTLAGVGTVAAAPEAGRTFVQADVTGTVLHNDRTYSYYGVSTELRSGRADLSLSGGLSYRF